MTPLSPETMWGDKLELVDKNGDKYDAFNLKLKGSATDEEKAEFEDYVMNAMAGNVFLKEDYPDMKDPYYTWEGKVVERKSLEGRKIPVASDGGTPWE